MSKTILIIGNGFDLAHDLPTRYSDFLVFSHEFQRLYKNNDNDIQSDSVDYQLADWLETELSILERQRISRTDENGEKSYILNCNILDKMHDDLQDNTWFEYFWILFKQNMMRGLNWIDFESEISFVIQQINNNTQDLNELFKNVDSRFEASHIDQMIQFDKAVDAAQKHDMRRKLSVQKFSEDLFNDLERLTEALEIYMAYFIEGQVQAEDLKPLRKIQEINPDYILSFNYTHTYQKIYDKDRRKSYCYIHGECRPIDYEINDFSQCESNLVLGIDEYLKGAERDENNRFAIFKKFVQRIRNHNDTSYRNWLNTIEKRYDREKKIQEKSNNVISPDNYDVYTYGHSLDVTDRDVLRLFMKPEWAHIRIFAYNKMAEGGMIENLLNIIGEDEVIEKAGQNPPMLELFRSPLEEVHR